MATGQLRPVKSGWERSLLICKKCSKKVGGGFGPKGKASLAKALRKELGCKGRKASLGIVETQCLGICPRDAVTVVDSAELRRWHVIPAGTGLDAVIAGLDLGSCDKSGG